MKKHAIEFLLLEDRYFQQSGIKIELPIFPYRGGCGLPRWEVEPVFNRHQARPEIYMVRLSIPNLIEPGTIAHRQFTCNAQAIDIEGIDTQRMQITACSQHKNLVVEIAPARHAKTAVIWPTYTAFRMTIEFI